MTTGPARTDDRSTGGDRYRELFAHAPVGQAIVSTDGRIVEANPAYHRILGYEDGQLIGRSITELTHPDDAEASAARMRGIATGEIDAYDIQKRYLRADGTPVWTHLSVQAVRRPDGALDHYLGLILDITEARREGDVLREGLEKLDRIFRAAPVGVATTDPDGVLTFANPAYCAIVGRSAGELVGRRAAELIHPQDRDTTTAARAEITSGRRQAVEYEQRYVRPDGTVVDAHLSLAGLAGPDGRIEQVVGVVQDITDQRRTQRELERTLDVLEERNRDLQHFASVASHDLKSPLQTIIGFLELLQQVSGDALDAQSRHFVTRATAGARRMQQLIDSILGFARSGTEALVPRDVDLRSVIDDVLVAVSSEIIDTQGAIEVDDPLPAVFADRSALELVLQNLVANALKFAVEGQRPQIRLEATARGGGVEIRVVDHGIGIAPEDRERVFTMFERVSSRRDAFGSGIGLATCARFVERHGGTIEATATPGGGTTVVVFLPDADASPLT